MNDVIVNGNAYNGIERIRLISADGGTKDFAGAEAYDNMFSGIPFALYNTVITNLKWCAIQSIEFTVNFPNATQAGDGCFMASWVTEIRLPNIRTIGPKMCGNAQRVVKCVLSEYLSNIPMQSFYGTKNLVTLVLPYNGVVTLAAQAFDASAIASGTGYVYVPSSQVDNYKADSAWSAYANQIRAMEDYPDEVA